VKYYEVIKNKEMYVSTYMNFENITLNERNKSPKTRDFEMSRTGKSMGMESSLLVHRIEKRLGSYGE
jgi:hypothetical protein